MAGRNLHPFTQPQVNAQAGDGEGEPNLQNPPPPVEGDQKKKSSADWTLPPHLRESLPLNPKGGRAPRPPASTSAS